jgi:outer membrane receptor protein involved in Fe transport
MVRFSGLSASLLAGASAAALGAFASPAAAQTASTAANAPPSPILTKAATNAEAENSEMLVTGSRVLRNGFAAPTPITVLSRDQLVASAPGNIADALNQLPVLSNSFRPSTTGASFTGAQGNGGNYLNLRGLGPNRTLVLLDGRRMPANSNGWIDTNQFPNALISSVDIVTGGASASYGSDAVSGVVNYILDSKFTGVKLNAQGGISSRGDGDSYRFGVAYGGSFADGRLRILASADHFYNKGIGLDYAGREWAEARWGLIPNGSPLPVGGPSQIIARDITHAAWAPGTVLTGTGNLRDISFRDDGTPFIRTSGTLRSAIVMSGGDGGRAPVNLETGLRITNLFGRTTYEVADDVELFAQGIYSDVEPFYQTSNGSVLSGTVFIDNAFLPQSVKDTMAARGVTSVGFGRFLNDIGTAAVSEHSKTLSAMAGFNAKLSSKWSLSGYGAIGRIDLLRTQDPTNPILENFYRAVDAVVSPTGTIVCRSTLTQPNDGCVPFNLFGNGRRSDAAVDYITAAVVNEQKNEQDILALDARGELFDLPAGPLAIAAGFEYRRESIVQVTDPISRSTISNFNIRGMPNNIVGRVGGFFVNNPQNLQGEFNVKEAYVEVAVPVFKEAPFAYSLDLNGAIRHADYSTTGGATTWKVGVTYAPIQSLRFRGALSRDIRAPNLAELFTTQQVFIGVQVRDPFRRNSLESITRISTGNTDLDPETADNLTAGVVFTPEFVPGLSMSVDYYDVKIKGAIIPATPQSIIDFCFQGNTVLCGLITRENDVIIQVRTPTLNVAQFRASGWDIEASYNFEVGGGRANIRALATIVDQFTETNDGLALNRAGELGPTNGVPDLRITTSATYKLDDFTMFLQGRYIGAGRYNNSWTTALLSEDDNSVPGIFYADLTLTYDIKLKMAKGMQVFATVNNLLDKSPPIVPTGSAAYPRATNPNIYDVVGRYFTLGVRATF